MQFGVIGHKGAVEISTNIFTLNYIEKMVERKVSFVPHSPNFSPQFAPYGYNRNISCLRMPPAADVTPHSFFIHERGYSVFAR